MPIPWPKRIRETGQLKVFNNAGVWSDSVDAAMKTFNSLAFNVQLVAEENEASANIVVLLATGPLTYSHDGTTAQTDAKFPFDQLHGQTAMYKSVRSHEMLFAVIFLPGKVPGATHGQKEVITVHEFIHASGGMGNDEHDSNGVFFGSMQAADGGLIEYLHEADTKPMPPMRVGSRTLIKMQAMWPNVRRPMHHGARGTVRVAGM
jgi:hypothetical protein